MASIVGVGTDIVEINRIRELMNQPDGDCLDGWFTFGEQQELRGDVCRVAERIALKEAVAKALGTGFQDEVTWMDIQVITDGLGRVSVDLTNGAAQSASTQKVDSWRVSVSHCRALAVASAIACSEE